MKPAVLAGVAIALATAGIGGWWVVAHASEARAGAARPAIDRDTMRIVAADVRVKIEVLNASGERGVARRAMRYLRDRGFDVVSVGNAQRQSDSSVVYDRSGHPAWASLASRALGGARVESRPDTSRYLDLTLVLGASFRPPPHILYP
jgi:hypothetical protein